MGCGMWDQYELRILSYEMDPQLEHTAIVLGRQLIQLTS